MPLKISFEVYTIQIFLSNLAGYLNPKENVQIKKINFIFFVGSSNPNIMPSVIYENVM